MNQIEIARRCPACGVSIREQAFFCPQCGRQLNNPPDTADTEPLKSSPRSWADSADHADTEPLRSSPRSWADRPDHLESPTVILDEPRLPGREKRSLPDPPGPAAPKQAGPSHLDQTQPLEKLREVSEEVLETASADPTVRFLLVAAVLVLASLFLLVLSKLIG